MFNYDEKYKFTETWFDPQIPNWTEVFNNYSKTNKLDNVLEIGCYEGRATIFLANNVLATDANYDVVDTFGGSVTEVGMGQTKEGLKKGDFIYDNFIHNISFHPNINFTIYREESQLKLPELVKQDKQYDFIYIDASHRADDTFVDAYFAHKLLKPGGLLIFDDFGWKDPNDLSPANSPELAVRTFFTCHEKDYEICLSGYQVGVIKKQ